MTAIDFSCKHDVLIRNADGTLLPMDEPYYEAHPEAPGVWRIVSSGDASYLVEGENEALAIDTGYGAGNIREYLQTLTDKPVRRVANTHYHFDHTANNGYFDAAYMSEESVPLATKPYPSFAGIEFIEDYPKIVIKEGDKIDLGGRVLEVFEIPCHAVGSLAFLDRKNRLLFTGDEVGDFCNLAGSVAQFVRNMEKLMALRSDFDYCLGGHGKLDASCVEKCLALGRDILAGTADPHESGKGPKKGPKGQEVPEGVVIYDRTSPHKEDGPKPGSRVNCMVSGHGVRILYDLRNVEEATVFLG